MICTTLHYSVYTPCISYPIQNVKHNTFVFICLPGKTLLLWQCLSSTGIIFQYSSSTAARNILSQCQFQYLLFKMILVSISSSICCLKQFQLVLVLVFLVTNNNSLYQFWLKQFQLVLQYLQFNKYVCHTTLLLQKKMTMHYRLLK